jgi:hypothetical protein
LDIPTRHPWGLPWTLHSSNPRNKNLSFVYGPPPEQNSLEYAQESLSGTSTEHDQDVREPPGEAGLMSVTELVSQLPMGWLKALASLNISSMSVTELVSQSPMGWLNALAPLNIPRMVVTELVSHLPMGWLKALAPPNIATMFVTELVSHWPMF